MDQKLLDKPKNNDLIDLVKLILSFMIVAVHTKLFDPYLYPWLRLAVPLFFVISSYFFFTKIRYCQDNGEKLEALKQFTLRNIKFYLFWFIVLFPYTAILRGWFDEGLANGVVTILLNMVIGSTFVASWFISALIIGTAIIFLVSKKLNNTVLLIIGAVLYVLISMRSSYMYFFKDWIEVLTAVVKLEAYFGSPVNSFPASIFWIALGKAFADGYFDKLKIKPSVILLVAGCALLFAEWFIIKHFSGNYNKDFYIMLAPASILIFNILIKAKPVSLKYAPQMRKISIITYAVHGTLVSAVTFIANHTVGTLPSPLMFLIIVALCVIGSLLVLLLEKYKYMKWLKYSH